MVVVGSDHGTIIRTIIVVISDEVKVYSIFFPVVFLMEGED